MKYKACTAFVHFSHRVNQFNITRARILDSINHNKSQQTSYFNVNITLKSHFWRQNVIVLPSKVYIVKLPLELGNISHLTEFILAQTCDKAKIHIGA